MARLDLQRPPGSGRFHTRSAGRPYHRGYTYLNHPTWGDSFGPVGPQGEVSLSGINPPTFAAVGGAKVFVLTGTGFYGTPTVSFCGTNITGANVVVNSATQITVTTPSASGFAALAGTSQPVFVITAAGNSNEVSVQVTASTVVLDEHVANPGAFTIAEIQTWVDANPDWADELLANEQARTSPRVTLVDWLEGFISHRDEGTIP